MTDLRKSSQAPTVQNKRLTSKQFKDKSAFRKLEFLGLSKNFECVPGNVNVFKSKTVEKAIRDYRGFKYQYIEELKGKLMNGLN